MYFELNLYISLIRDNYVHKNHEKFPFDWKMIQIASDFAEITDFLVEKVSFLHISIRPQLIFLLLVSKSPNAEEALAPPSHFHTFCYSFKSKAGICTKLGKTAGVPLARPCRGHSPVPALPKVSAHPWDLCMHFQELRKGLKLSNPILKSKYMLNSWVSRPAYFLLHL